MKCLKAEEKNNTPQYWIHYSGWNKRYLFELKCFDLKVFHLFSSTSWDEWVPSPRVLKYNDENLKKQQELLTTHGFLIQNIRINRKTNFC